MEVFSRRLYRIIIIVIVIIVIIIIIDILWSRPSTVAD